MDFNLLTYIIINITTNIYIINIKTPQLKISILYSYILSYNKNKLSITRAKSSYEKEYLLVSVWKASKANNIK